MSNEKDLQQIGESAARALAEMVAALECDYDRLEELREFLKAEGLMNPEAREELAELEAAAGDCTDREEAEQRIHEDPLSVEVRTGWFSPGDLRGASIDEFRILLGTGGPAIQIVGELVDGEPTRACPQVQDWGTSWTEYRGDAISQDDLLTYCRCFYFGEG